MRNCPSSASSSCPRRSAVKPLAYRYCFEADFLNRRVSRSDESAAIAPMALRTSHAPPSTRTRAALTDGVLSGRRGGSSANRPCRERPAAGAVEDAGRVTVAVAEVDVEASPVT
ncbi:hypothethical protein [Ralstonia solanacearum PSI07]|nr:hypothethical protein [Ralstonia solanacearum PSI07]